MEVVTVDTKAATAHMEDVIAYTEDPTHHIAPETAYIAPEITHKEVAKARTDAETAQKEDVTDLAPVHLTQRL